MRYMARLDVGILPYVLNTFTSFIMPAKLKEYLAAGLPIVATSLPEIRRFADLHPGVIEFADEADAFVSALRSAVAVEQPGAEEKRAGVAMNYDWAAQIATMRTSMQTALLTRARRP
jgi:glycosyltransferase involved in cell wall biosynthesis